MAESPRRRPYGGTDAGFSIPSTAAGTTVFGAAGAPVTAAPPPAAPDVRQRGWDRSGHWLEGRVGERALPESIRATAPVPAREPRRRAPGGGGGDHRRGITADAERRMREYDRNPGVNTFDGRELTPEELRPDRRIMPSGSTAGDVRGATRRAVAGIRDNEDRARGNVFRGLNPMSNEANLLRRLEISQSGFKGSPSARRAMAEAYLGQLGALNAASAQAQKAGDTGYLDGATDENRANEGAAQRRMAADMFNVSTEMEQDRLAAMGAMTPERELELKKLQQEVDRGEFELGKERELYEAGGLAGAVDEGTAARVAYLQKPEGGGYDRATAEAMAVIERNQAGVNQEGSPIAASVLGSTRDDLDALFANRGRSGIQGILHGAQEWLRGLGDGADNTALNGTASAQGRDLNAYEAEDVTGWRNLWNLGAMPYRIVTTDDKGQRHARYTDDEDLVRRVRGMAKR